MRPRRFEVIACPRCGREYLPAEIFYPKSVFGKPFPILRDVYGKILDFEGTSLDLEEEYTCDKCNTNFITKIKVQFVAESATVGNIDEEYVSPLEKTSLFGNNE